MKERHIVRKIIAALIIFGILVAAEYLVKSYYYPIKTEKRIDRDRLAVYRRTVGERYPGEGLLSGLEISVPFSEIPKKSGQYDRQYPH